MAGSKAERMGLPLVIAHRGASGHRPENTLAAYELAGKSGTVQVFSIGQDETYEEDEVAEHLRDHALFISFAPIDKPRIAVAVIVENGRSGSRTAAPIARAIMDRYLAVNPNAF